MTREEYEELKKVIDYHMKRYYDEDSPEISDYEYDQLMQKLKAAEREHPDWIGPDSPSQKIGGTALGRPAGGKREAGVKVTHDVPMLSIEDVFTKEDVKAWVSKVHELHPDCLFSVEVKVDGLSMSIRYEQKEDEKLHLVLAETRGDGLVGEDVTANARVIPDVQQVLDLPYKSLELRGEVYMAHEDFERFNEEMEEQGRKPAANPRNLAAGTLRQLDPSITKKRGLRMFVFNVQRGPEEIMESHVKALDLLEEKGVSVVCHRSCRTADEVLSAIDDIGNMRDTLHFDLDGAVVKIDHVAYRNDFPAGSKYSSGHIAYKYPPEERIVVMDRILVDVGRTGKLTFTGEFHDRETGKPARLCGTSVSRATLHNQDYIQDMKIGEGGEYRLFKSGEIIPKLNGCVREPEVIFSAPKVCPVCGQPLVREEDTADIRCINPACPAQVVNSIAYFASRSCMNIMGLGDTLVEALVQKGYLHSYADIYRLKEHRKELIEEGIIGKEKNTDKVLAAIEASKENSPVLLLTGLGIRNCGKAAAREILSHYDSIDALAEAGKEELTQIPDVGETTAACIHDFFAAEENRKILQELRDAGVNLKMEQKEAGSQKLAGLTIVVTGTLPTLGRKEAEELIVSNGGKASGSVSKKTSYVLAGEAAGSKLTKAQQLGIPVISEDEFRAML